MTSDWSFLTNHARALLQIARDPSFGTTIDSGSTDTTSFAPTMQYAQDYQNGGQLYWRVQATDTHGTQGTWSAAQSLVFATKLVATLSTSSMPHRTTATVTVTVKDGVGHVVPGAKIVATGAGIVKTTKTSGSTGKASFKVHPTKVGKITFTVSKSGDAGTKAQVVVF